jgi:L-rhamnose-H+ transport protein
LGANPFVGVLFHCTGGLASASCYLPFRFVRKWSWETSWLIQGFFSFLLAPILAAFLLVPEVAAVLHHTPTHTLVVTYVWGLLWGIGGLTFGLSIRYLGIALGYAVALGFTTAFGTLMPPIFSGEMPELVRQTPGQIILLGIGVCMVGIVLSGMAGYSKERELSSAEKAKTVAEFNFPKGILVAVFAGVMSACFAYGLATGKPIGILARNVLIAHDRALAWQNLPILIVILLGGLTTNFLWCVVLMVRNGSWGQFLPVRSDTAAAESELGGKPANLSFNYLLCASVGIMWYLQFFFYSIGQSKMGKYDFSSWTLHMASIIIFSTLWGIWLKEWHGTSRKTKILVALGLTVLVFSTVLVGYGNYLNVQAIPVG